MSDKTREAVARAAATNSPSYAPAPIIMERGQGAYLWDADGRRYLDFIAGIAVCSLGHAHPRLTEALGEQVGRLLHVSNLFLSAEQVALMGALTSRSFADRVFLCNSGAEACEAALKLARRYQTVARGEPERIEFVTMRRSFHGRTFGALSATGQPKYHKGFEPLVPGFHYAAFNDLDSVRALIGPRTAAVMVEPVQGEGGVIPATPDFLRGIRQLCDEHGALMIADEVQAGVGRTGHLFAYQGYGIEPDIVMLAKGLGGGVPIGAMLSTEEIFGGFERGSHGTTFGGNPLACRAASVVLEVVESERLAERAAELGERLRAGLEAIGRRTGVFRQVRGLGLMCGAEVGPAAKEIVSAALQEGLLINAAGGETLRFVPPLIIEAEQVDEALERLERAIGSWRALSGA